MITVEFTKEELDFVRAAILEVRVQGTVQDIVSGRLVLSDLTKSILDKLTHDEPVEAEPEPETNE